MSPLLNEIRELIAHEGPISIERYMALCLGHPRHGYYMTRDPFGQAGDFTTAPEISQMFGELIGVWAASVWQQMGAPAALRLVELGPGRGTLMADALRAARSLPAFRAALDVRLVEMSPVLRTTQERTLAGCGVPITWHPGLEEIDEGAPLIVIANEFFDALPIRQAQFRDGGWRERLVGLDAAGALTFGLSGEAVSMPPVTGSEGDIREFCPAAMAIAGTLAGRLRREGGALLAIDYGYAVPQPGDSLQALRTHRFSDVLADPGDADLTAHVDFSALASAARAAGALAHPLLTQRTLLERLGILARAGALARARPDQAGVIETALNRLTGAGPEAMGTLFKALCVSAPTLPAPAAFDSPDPLIAHISG